MKPLRKI